MVFGALLYIDPNSTFLYKRKWAWDLDRTIRSFRPTHLLVCESWMSLYVDTLGGESWPHIVIDLHNVEAHLRLQSGGITAKIRARLMKHTECNLAAVAEEVWVCSDSDASLARQNVVDPRIVKVVPNKVDVSYYKGIPHTGIRSFGMVALWSYSPNEKAAEILLTEVWPKIGRSIPILVGKEPTAVMKEAAGNGALVTGEVDDVRRFLGKIRTMVIPLTEGGGTRMKILEAFAAGIPVVATAKAVEGIEAKHLKHCVICPVDEMATWVRKLWATPALEEKLRKNALELVKEKYSYAS